MVVVVLITEAVVSSEEMAGEEMAGEEEEVEGMVVVVVEEPEVETFCDVSHDTTNCV